MDATKWFWTWFGFALVILAASQCTKAEREKPESHKERICKFYSKTLDEYEQCYKDAKIP